MIFVRQITALMSSCDSRVKDLSITKLLTINLLVLKSGFGKPNIVLLEHPYLSQV